MSVKVEKLEANQVKLMIEVPADQVNKAIDRSFKKNAAKANVPGFRKGKVPRQMFVKMFGIESLYPDAIDFVTNEAYSSALQEQEIDPVDYPELNYEKIVSDFKKDEALTIEAVVTVRPVPVLGDYKGIEVKKADTAVLDADVDAQIKTMQDRKAEWTVKEEGVAELGDTVVIDFEGFVDDVAFEGGKGTNHSLELGSNSFIPGFEEQLAGHGIAEEVEVHVTFPEEYQAEELAGKPALFKCLIHDIKSKEVPALTDELAVEMDETVANLAELKEKIKASLTEQKQNAAVSEKENAVLDAVVANATFEIPEAMIKNELEHMVKDFDNRLKSQGMSLEMYFQFSGQNEEAMQAEMRPEAEKRISRALVLDAIAKAEKVEATNEDIDAEIAKVAEQMNLTVDEVKKRLDMNVMNSFMIEIVSRKTIEIVVNAAVEAK